MSVNDERKIPVNRLTVTRINLEERPIGSDETREIVFAVEPEEKPVGLENGPLEIRIRYDDL